MVYNGNPHVSPFLIVLNQNDQHQIMSPAGPPAFARLAEELPAKCPPPDLCMVDLWPRFYAAAHEGTGKDAVNLKYI